MSKGMDGRGRRRNRSRHRRRSARRRRKEGSPGPPPLALTAPVRGCHDAARRRLNGAVAAGHLLGRPGTAPARLGRDVFNRPTLTVARDLLGKFIVHRHGCRIRSAMITEVEAVVPQDPRRMLVADAGRDESNRSMARAERPMCTWSTACTGCSTSPPPGQAPGRAGAGVLAGTADAPEPVLGPGGWPGIWASTSVSMASTRRRRAHLGRGPRDHGSRTCTAPRAARRDRLLGRVLGRAGLAVLGRAGFVAPRHTESG